jgi:hypothetical protein
MGAAKFAGFTTLAPHYLLTLRYGRVVENTRAKAHFGQFRYTTREAVLDLYGIGAERAASFNETAPEERKVAAA